VRARATRKARTRHHTGTRVRRRTARLAAI
jgi:hypothetical protein